MTEISFGTEKYGDAGKDKEIFLSIQYERGIDSNLKNLSIHFK